MKKKNKRIKKIIRKLILSLATVLVLCCLPFFGTTNAVLFDTETSNGNLFSAGSLDFSLRNSENRFAASPLFDVFGIRPGYSETKTIKVKKDGSLDFNYRVKAKKTDGSDDFCNALNLQASLNGASKYNGSLIGFTFDSSGEGTWTFTVSFTGSDEALQNQVCDFNLVFAGWQTESDGSWGFVDEEILSNSVVGGDWIPPVPEALFPQDNKTLDDSELYIDWSDVVWDFPVTYDYELFLFNPDTHPDPDLPIRYSVYGRNVSRHPVAGFALGTPEGTYWWHVRACDSNHFCSPWTPARKFTVHDPSGDVVINELMWMGSYSASEADSTNDNDEWIELRNMTNAPIDLSGWYLTDRSGTKITIPAGKTISPNGFYVISRFDAANSNIKNEPNQVADNLILDNDHLQIKLYNAGGLLIDTAGDGDAPAAGFWGGASHWSMERNNTPGNGALAGSWHTCIDHASSIYWDVGVEDLGTPGGPNLSENDPSWYSAVTLNSFQNLQGILNQVQGDNISAQDGSNTEESCQPDIQLVLASDKKSVSFEARCIADFQKLNYEIVYDAKPEEKGMAGSIDLRGENSVNRDNLKLGTCSSFGEVCVYDEGMTKINLKVTLFKENGESLELSKMMDY